MLTLKLKGWLRDNGYATDAASDTDYRAAMVKAIVEGNLTADVLAQCQDDSPDPAKMIADAVAKAIAPIAAQVEAIATRAPAPVVPETKTIVPDSKVTPTQVFGGDGAATPNVRVKSPIEGYSTTKSALFYPKDHRHFPNRPVLYGGMQVETPSQKDMAVTGAWFKYAVNSANRFGTVPRWARLTDHDKALVEYAMHEEPFTGIIKGDGVDSGGIGIDGRKLVDFERKALLDDSTSGGLEAVPIVFDAALITTPVLYGQVFPLVEVIPVARGRRVEGVSMTNPTFTSGTAEGTSITALDTASFISAFDNTIYNAVGAMEIGNDFQEDSPINITAQIVQKYGEKAQEWLDNQIVNGDGTTEPQGLRNASGLTDIGNPAGGANAAPQVVDFEKLLFGVTLPYRTPADRCVFVMNDTSYQRARSIAAASGWQTRAFGMDNYESYTLCGHKVAVQNDCANTWAGFANLSRYRMYRRLGLNVRVENSGSTLALKNCTLIVVRMRWAGKITSGSAASYSDNWQT